MDNLLARVPDFGEVVYRQRLIKVFESRAPTVTVICAPAGYGKSVLAAQAARLPLFDQALWISVEALGVSGDEALKYVSCALAPPSSDVDGTVATTLPLGSAALADILNSIREHLRRFEGLRVCAVVDGLESALPLDSYVLLGVALREMTDPGSRLVVTCRTIGQPSAFGPRDLWCLDEGDLRFSRAEIEALLRVSGVEVGGDTVIDGLAERSGGQAALLSMMVLHEGFLSGDSSGVPNDLVWYLDHNISRLGDGYIRGLYCAALIRSGSLHEIGQVVDLSLDAWRKLSATVPLLKLGGSESPGRVFFTVHAVLAECLCEIAEARLPESAIEQLRETVLLLLEHREDHFRILDILLSRCTPEERARWCERAGAQILRTTGTVGITQCLESIPPLTVAASARLLLLWAATLRQSEQVPTAIDKARIARQVAEHEQDWPTQVDASLLLARLALDVSDLSLLTEVLEPLDALPAHRISKSSKCLVDAYLGVAAAQHGRFDEVDVREQRILGELRWLDPSSEAYVFTANCLGGIRGMCQGRWSDTARYLAPILNRPGVAPVQRLLIQSNAATSALELGRIGQAAELVAVVVPELRSIQSVQLLAHALGTAACAHAGLDDFDAAVKAQDESSELMRQVDDLASVAGIGASWALAARGCGQVQEALQSAEDALSAAITVSAPILVRGLAECEVAAALLAMGDCPSATATATRLRKELSEGCAARHLLAVDLVLAESHRIAGDRSQAIAVLQQHRDYILTESANFLLAMNIRAFPGLLGVLAASVGADAVPIHLLRMIPPRYAEPALVEATSLLSAGDVALLADRLGVDPPESVADVSVASAPTWTCYVKMFGGLEVTTDNGVMGETQWKRRKARAILTMLAVRRQDIPRDIIVERLWPHMEASNATQNFYVAFSALKGTLSQGGDPGSGGRFVQHAHGLCRLTPLVRTELEDFEELVGSLRSADRNGEAVQVLDLARRLTAMYRGELLPGDLYEDWVADVREHASQDFCDCMVTAGRASRQNGELELGISLLRRAISAIPEREDLYRELMLCQLHAGQRSAGIQTFFACKRVLAEQLGMDPSEETMAVYMELIALEEREQSSDSLYASSSLRAQTASGDLDSCWDL